MGESWMATRRLALRRRSVAGAVAISLVLSVIGWVTASAAISPAGSAEVGPGPAAPRSAVPWKVPGYGSAVIVAATASRLLVQLAAPCQGGSSSLAWFNPATRSLAMVLAMRDNGKDEVVGVVPYYLQGRG
jgi:hypothetical protein